MSYYDTIWVTTICQSNRAKALINHTSSGPSALDQDLLRRQACFCRERIGEEPRQDDTSEPTERSLAGIAAQLTVGTA